MEWSLGDKVAITQAYVEVEFPETPDYVGKQGIVKFLPYLSTPYYDIELFGTGEMILLTPDEMERVED